MANNIVFQKVSLDSKDYINGLKAISREQRETTTRVSKALGEQSKKHGEASEEIKKKNTEVIKSLRDLGKEFKDNIKSGTVLAASAGLASAFKSTAQQATRSVLEISKGMGHLQSRFDLTLDRTKKLKKELSEIATKTGVKGGSVVSAADELIGASGSRKQAFGIESVAQFSAMGGGEASDIARSVVDYLKGSGQDFNTGNVQNLLESATAIYRNGDLSLQDSLKAITIDPASKAKLGLSNKENAAMISSASGIGQDRGASIAGMNALLSKSVEGFGGGAALSGILGVGGFMKNGKFDMGKLQSASQNLDKQGLSKNDFVKLLESSGLSGTESEGLYSILKDFDKFSEGFNKVIRDQKTLEKSFQEATDNLPDSLSRFNEKVAKSAQEVLSPAANILKDVIDGNFVNAIKNVPGAAKDTLGAAYDNKGMLALGLGGLGLSGALFKKLGGVLFGGVAKGMAVDQVTQGKVQAVYVVNASEFGSAMNSIPGVSGSSSKLGNLGGLLGMVPGIGITAAGAYGTGVLASEVANTTHQERVDRYGTDSYRGFITMPKKGNSVSPSAPQFENSESMMNTLNSVLTNLKVQVEVVDNGGRFTLRPTRGDISNTN